MAIIYHLTTRQEWLQAKLKGQYEAPSLTEEGFIHWSEERQIVGVRDRHFRGQTDLLKLISKLSAWQAPFIMTGLLLWKIPFRIFMGPSTWMRSLRRRKYWDHKFSTFCLLRSC